GERIDRRRRCHFRQGTDTRGTRRRRRQDDRPEALPKSDAAGFFDSDRRTFWILATGVDNLTIDNLTIDTNRDGIDLDSSRNVRISNTSVNAPNDDAIVLKGTHALGFARASENITIANSLVSGYDIGSLVDGTYQRT